MNIQKQLDLMNIKLGEFKTCAWYHKEMGQLTFLTEDCSYSEEYNPNSCIQLLRRNSDNKIVGFNIENPELWMQVCKDKT